MNDDRLYGIDALMKIAEVLTGLSKAELGEFTLDELIAIIYLELDNNIAAIHIALARIEQRGGLEMNWFTEVEGNILNRFDLYLDGDYRPWIDEQPADDFYLVHCVSGDNAQGAGFAKVLNDRYHFRDSLCADLAESFPGFGTNGWTFDKRYGDFFRIPLLRNNHGEYSAGKMQRMKFEGSIGSIYATDRCPHILGLVTKEHYYDKPSLDDMRAAIHGLRSRLETIAWYDDWDNPMLTEIMMPHIGCGLDKLKWDDVKEIIFDELHELGEACKIRVVAAEPKRPVIKF